MNLRRDEGHYLGMLLLRSILRCDRDGVDMSNEIVDFTFLAWQNVPSRTEQGEKVNISKISVTVLRLICLEIMHSLSSIQHITRSPSNVSDD